MYMHVYIYIYIYFHLYVSRCCAVVVMFAVGL